ncbi:MAG: hypothetical protein AB1750_11060 [Chloroflexota bacterium]
MPEPLYFQWQNEVLLKTIYPMRLVKLRDFLGFYAEADVWKQYKDKDIATLGAEVKTYEAAQAKMAEAAYAEYKTLRAYFLTKDARAEYAKKFDPLDEPELTEINNLHAMFADSWPKDIRGERSFVDGMIAMWTNHRNLHRDWVNSRRKRQEAMDPNHPKYEPEKKELEYKVGTILPMAQNELDQLRAFLATYDKIEARKLKWYQQTKSDPNFKTPEDEFMKSFRPDTPVAVRDLALWKIEEYKNGLAKKNQYELLELISQKFKAEPTRFPLWLQYMVVHFSGMRYASAHSSWADPKDLLARLEAPKVAAEVKKMSDEEVVKACNDKVAAYEGTAPPKPKLATATEKQWKDQIGWYLPSVKSNGVSYKRDGLAKLRAAESAYEKFSLSTQEALNALLARKKEFPAWAWKQIVKLTPLRVNEVTDAAWEKLTPAEETERLKPEYTELRNIMDAWINFDASAWREEHGRTHELIVTRAVCNETAEHIQHLRGHLPPGGLTPKPNWYLTNETEGKVPGTPRPYYKYPSAAEAYTQGASILWLRFVDNEPNDWQVAKQIQTKDGVGLLPAQYGGGRGGASKGGDKGGGKAGKPASASGSPSWAYQVGETTTRSRSVTDAAGVSAVQKQYLRWIHEATFVESAETPDGPVVITFETDLPGGDDAKSCIGLFRKPLAWYLTDGPEDQYNRSFVGYLPEGQVPVDHISAMLDWKKVLRK